MSRVARALAATGVLVATLLGTALPAPAAPVRAGQGPPAASDAAILDLVGCLQGSHRLAVVFLIDESQSLQLTDPGARRVDAAQAALSTLTGLTEGAGSEKTSVDVTFAAFANDYRQVRPWTALRSSSEPRLLRSLGSFAQRDKGTDTDFVNALAGARRALADRSAAVTADGGAAPCKAVLFFTDGEYDVAIRTTKDLAKLGRTKPYAPGIALTSEDAVTRAEAAGRKALCDEGGLADGLRGDDITLLTIALAKDLSTDSQAFLGSVTTGGTGAATCGRPVDSPPGSYLAADDVDVLIARFDEVAARVAGGTLLPAATAPKLCGDAACDGGSRSVNLDASVRRLRVFALAPQPGLVVQLDGPGGTARIDGAGTSTIGAVTVGSTTVAGRGYAIELDRPSETGDWNGPWKVALLDPTGKQVGKPATLQLYLFSDLGIRLTQAPTLVRGEAAKLSATLVAPKGIDVKQLVADGSATLRLEDPVSGASRTVPLAGPPVGPYTGTFAPPADYRSSSYVLSLELRATTHDGATVVARSATTPVIVRRPGGAIQFAPDHLVLPTLTGAGSTSADLVLAGGKKDGCVWFGPAKATAPAEAGALTVRYDGREVVGEGSCITVAAGATEVVTVEVDPVKRATGAVRGVLEVHEKTTGAQASVTDVPYQLDLAVGIDQARRLILAVLLLLGGVALPMALLLVLNAVTARFQTLAAVQGAVLPVRVNGGSIYRTDGARPVALSLRTSDFSSLRDTGSVRRFTFGGIDFRAKAARNPFGVTAALAAPAGGAERLKGGAGSKVALDPSLAGSWIFLLDPDRTRRAGTGAAEGNLIAFVAEGELRPQLDRLMPDVNRRLPDTAADLAGLVRSKKAKRRKAATADAPATKPEPEPTDPLDAVGADLDDEPGATDPG